MAKQEQSLSTREFASRAGITTAKVSRLIREGKIKARKKSGRWMISPDQLNFAAGKKAAAGTQKSAEPQAAGGKKAYTVAEFAAMTYLTEKGVHLWLKQGRLRGRQDDNGRWLIDAHNLEIPDVKRLLR